jgi:virginiamycin B lyase
LSTWHEWALPGAARAYAVWVDQADRVWLSDWASNSIVRFDPLSQRFEAFASDRPGAAVRQIMGRAGEVWAAESAHSRLVMIPDR